MFEIQVEGNSEKRYKLPINTTNTDQIYKYIHSVLCLEDENTHLSFNNLLLSRDIKYNLVDIGYSPEELLKVIISTKKTGFFNITQFNYPVTLPIDLYSTVFTIKTYFSEKFYTVNSNIILKHNSQILRDDQNLYEINTDAKNPIEVSVSDKHILVHVYHRKFLFVCIGSNSNISQLKDTISMYSMENNTINHCIKYSENMVQQMREQNFNDEKSIDECPIEKVLKTIPLFEFESNLSPISTTCKIKIVIQDKHSDYSKSTEYGLCIKTSVYSITCALEKEFGIDRRLFEVENREGKIDFVSPDRNSTLHFAIYEPLTAKINQQASHFSYLMSIKDLQNMFQFDTHNFGIIINKHYAYHDEESKYLLAHFLNSSSNINPMTEIILKASKTPSYQINFVKVDEKGNKSKRKHFIVPKDMHPIEISKIYLHQHYNSIEVMSIQPNEFQYRDANERYVEYYLIDESKGISFGSIHSLIYGQNQPKNVYHENAKVRGKNPRILDLILEIYMNHHARKKSYFHIFSKYEIAEASFLGQKLPFYEPLSNIFDYKKDKIIITGYNEQKHISIYNFANNRFESRAFNFYDEHYKVSEIIYQLSDSVGVNYSELRLYADFNELNRNDYPSLYRLNYNFLILNKFVGMKHFIIANGTSLTCDLNITYNYFHELPAVIAGMFSLDEKYINFSAFIGNQKYQLPSKFDAGSFPDDTVIEIYYKYERKNKFTFICEKSKEEKALIIPDVELPIKKLIPTIQRELNMMNVSKTVFQFKFNEFIIPIPKSFCYYQIPGNSIIKICLKPSFIPITLAPVENATEKVQYFFNDGDKIKDVRKHFKTHFEPDILLSSERNEKSVLDDDYRLTKGMSLYYFTANKKTITSDGSLGQKEFQLSEIFKVSEAIAYFKQLFTERNIYIFEKKTETKSYEAVDINKRLYEIPSELYVHKYIPKIDFSNYEIFTEREYYSDQNTVEWLINTYISKIMLMDPSKIMIKKIAKAKKKKVDKYQIIGNLVKFPKLIIELASEKSESKEKQKYTSKNKFKPKIKPVKQDQGKPEEKDKNKSNEQEDKKKSDEQEDKKKSDEQEDKKKSDEQKDQGKPEEINKSESNEQEDRKKSDEQEDQGKPEEINKSESNEQENQNKQEEKEESKSDDDDDDSDSSSSDDIEDHDNQGEPLIEEEETDEDVGDGDTCTYNFQIGKEEPQRLSFAKDATINDARIKIAKLNGDIDPCCVSIIFAGKVLKKEIEIKRLNLDDKDILQVLIRSIEDVLLQTAKALRVYGEADIEEYYSEYEEE